MIYKPALLLTAAGAMTFAQTPVRTCTVTNIRGVPVQETVCGGSALFNSRSCTPGALNNCKAGPAGTTNNCTLVQACATGCSQGVGVSASCFSGAAPLTVSPAATLGGDEISLQSNLVAPHSNSIINLMLTVATWFRAHSAQSRYCPTIRTP